MYLNNNKSMVQNWEQGAKKPSGPSLKLLNIVDCKGLDVLACPSVSNHPRYNNLQALTLPGSVVSGSSKPLPD
ncbi:helix-turn-helix domain-containing protein [Microbulbifer sp. EKSA008]|uniref:helix-turn-helix domain-containing protein n=1 Tax=Microbulbifer sp. EKSA008 TaxID=3243367 RepID=UPI0040421880